MYIHFLRPYAGKNLLSLLNNGHLLQDILQKLSLITQILQVTGILIRKNTVFTKIDEIY